MFHCGFANKQNRKKTQSLNVYYLYVKPAEYIFVRYNFFKFLLRKPHFAHNTKRLAKASVSI